MHRVVRDLITMMKPRFGDPNYKTRVDIKKRAREMVTPRVRPVLVPLPRPRGRGRQLKKDSVTPAGGMQDLLGEVSDDAVE